MVTTRREVSIDKDTEVRVATRVSGESAVRQVEINEPVEKRSFDSASQIRITPERTFSTDKEIMPSVIREERHSVSQEQEKRVEAQKLTQKEKVMLCVYGAIAVILALIVFATGMAITSASSDVNALESRLAARSEIIAVQESELAYYMDDETIVNAAASMGMESVTAATELELIDMSGVAEYTAKTNPFDAFCDFISSIFGG